MRGGGQLSCSTLTLKSDEARELPLGESEHHSGKTTEKALSTRKTNHTKNLKALLKTNVFWKLKNANEKEQLCHPELDSGSLKETEILNSNKSCKTEQSTFQNDNVDNVIAGLTRNRRVAAVMRFRIPSHKLRSFRNDGRIGEGFNLAEGSTHVANCNNMRKIAFTLAEVLITLGIIGIVAAMTLPTLIQKYQDKADYVHLKKIYSQLLQATMMIEQEYGSISEWELSNDSQADSTMIMERYKKYFKSIKTCEEDMSACLPNVIYKTSIGTNYASWYSSSARASFLLPDGAIIMFNSQGGRDSAFQIYVDLNGWRKPNQLGNDFFYFYYFNAPKSLRPGGWYSTKEEKEANFKSGCMNANGYYCANWLLENGNKDYFKCKDLSYKGKTKCK